ncbi:hypothetical protein ZEAMMB73_Zm00001d009766 [Zea mays]|uniref:Uncharacterized protein n=1 Tax=Zea mays TaxID=4577 RepID=A0A1D6FLW8_MAIZE|nr:hypothetical protein ZEAMMB73_Zm00001d009766 [Zea mays]
MGYSDYRGKFGVVFASISAPIFAALYCPTKICFVLFDDVQDVNSLPQIKSVFARVVVKFPRCHDSQHFILQDITGSKIEAISNRNNVPWFDALLTQGCTYTLYRVGFCLNWEEIQFWNIGHGLEVALITHTIVEPFIKPIQFPPFPKYLMPFHEVYQQPHKSFVGCLETSDYSTVHFESFNMSGSYNIVINYS